MIKLDPNNGKELVFDLNIQGAKQSPEVLRLVLESEGSSIVINGYYDNNKIYVKIPKLTEDVFPTKLLESEIVKGKLEVVVDGRYFVPWNDSISIHRPVTVTSNSMTESIDIQEDDSTLSITEATVETIEAEQEAEVDEEIVEEVQEPKEMDQSTKQMLNEFNLFSPQEDRKILSSKPIK